MARRRRSCGRSRIERKRYECGAEWNCGSECGGGGICGDGGGSEWACGGTDGSCGSADFPGKRFGDGNYSAECIANNISIGNANAASSGGAGKSGTEQCSAEHRACC